VTPKVLLVNGVVVAHPANRASRLRQQTARKNLLRILLGERSIDSASITTDIAWIFQMSLIPILTFIHHSVNKCHLKGKLSIL
jgi:hypothetical protein